MRSTLLLTLFLLLAWSCTGHGLDIPAPQQPSAPEEPAKPQEPDTPDTPAEGVVWVASADKVAALGEVPAGTEIVWRKGAYAGQTVVIRGAGTVEKPVVLRAEEPGEVRFTGASRLTVKGSGVVVRDFWWQDPEAVKGKAVVTFDRGSEGCVLEQCAITGDRTAQRGDVDAKWVSLYGRGHSVEHCTFRDKRNMDTLLVVWLETDVVPRHKILNNRFERPVTLYDENGKPRNGQETIRIGDSNSSMQDAQCTVEGNYFYRCNGELAEIVSNKSCANLYRGNLFVECQGSLTLRHGNRCYVAGNYFLGNGVEGTGGVRIIGEEHTVENNYMENLRGTGYKTAICLVRGQRDPALSGYWQVKRAVVRRNVVVDCRYAFQVNYGSASQPMPVVETLIENNIVSLSSEKDYAVNCASDPAPDIEWRDNTFCGGRMAGAELPAATQKPALPDVRSAVERIRGGAGIGW